MMRQPANPFNCYMAKLFIWLRMEIIQQFNNETIEPYEY